MTSASEDRFQRRQALLERTYLAFNVRDLDGALAAMHPAVIWPNGMEGGVVRGHEGIRQYWTRQWTMIDPQVDPVGFRKDPDGRVAVRVHQVIRNLTGQVLMDRIVEHVYAFKGELIDAMEIRDAP